MTAIEITYGINSSNTVTRNHFRRVSRLVLISVLPDTKNSRVKQQFGDSGVEARGSRFMIHESCGVGTKCSEEGSYSRLIRLVYHSTLGSSVIKKRKKRHQMV